MATIQIPEEIDNKLNRLVELTGQSKEAFAIEALLSRMEDLEDLALATERLQNPGKRVSFTQLKKDLGLED